MARSKPIDSDLEPVGTAGLSNAANAWDVRLPDDLTGPVRVSRGSAQVAFSLAGAAAGERRSAGSVARYEEALPGVDAVYSVGADAVKEELVLAGPVVERSFGFELDPSAGLTPRINRVGGVDFVRAGGGVPLRFAAPVMRDDAGATSTDLAYELRRRDGAGTWTLGLDADTPWLRDRDRVWPVIVDPTVDFSEDHDTYIVDGTGADTQHGPATLMEVATGGSQNRRALLNFNLSGIPERAVVSEAEAFLHTPGGSGDAATCRHERPAAGDRSRCLSSPARPPRRCAQRASSTSTGVASGSGSVCTAPATQIAQRRRQRPRHPLGDGHIARRAPRHEVALPRRPDRRHPSPARPANG